ncbi:hypothetical protein C7H84_34760 [Burkholderia sp. Nafp2/4-1b]|nr:hypothetical protein C7H84_34760 [Burkholderia sp. Nafp2/4-1b]
MVRLTSLEEALFADATGEARDRMTATLVRGMTSDVELSPAVRFAASAALDVINTLWARYHECGGSRPRDGDR